MTAIPYEDLAEVNKRYRRELFQAAEKTITKGWYILGENVRAFESEFAEWNSSPHCVGVASGLDAITLSLKALGVGNGDDVLVPSNTYIASILAVINAGAHPVLIEPDIRTYNVNANVLSKRLTKRTRVVMVVHLYGKPCPMPEIVQFCRDRNLFLVEDCAQSHGAEIANQKTGTFGDCGAFSFYPTKNLGALGDGGAVLCKEARVAEKIRSLRNYGSLVRYQNEDIGVNSRLDEIQAAFLRIKLKDMGRINSHKKMLAAEYISGLSDDFILPLVQEGVKDVFHIFPVRHPKRNYLKEYLAGQGIGTDIHYPLPPHRQKAYRKILSGEYPISDEIHKTILSLPVSTAHTLEDVREVIRAMNQFA